MTQSIRVTSYNVLAESYATKRLYPTVPSEILDWKYRGPLIVSRMVELNPDVACLQEVEAQHWAALRASLLPFGWDGIFAQKRLSRVDGCALLYQTRAATLVHSETVYFNDGPEPSGHLGLVGIFATAIGPVRIATTHLRWQRETSEPDSHIGYRQAAQLLRQLPGVGDTTATVVCGDLNVPPQHPVVQLLEKEGFSDAYASSPQFTCVPNGHAARIDFILVSEGLNARGETLPVLTNASVLPNADQPSDHLPITARIEFAAKSRSGLAAPALTPEQRN